MVKWKSSLSSGRQEEGDLAKLIKTQTVFLGEWEGMLMKGPEKIHGSVKAHLRPKSISMHRRQTFCFDLGSGFCYYESTMDELVAREVENISKIVVWGGNEEDSADSLHGK